MNITEDFKQYFFSQKNKPSKITIKNYISDIRRFLLWYEKIYQKPFTPEKLTVNVTESYEESILTVKQDTLPAIRSVKRYLSSLRKFAQFLEDSGAIKANPFKQVQPQRQRIDSLHIKEFKNYLYTEHASKLTIKNYITDVNQFLQWFEQEKLKGHGEIPADILMQIERVTIEKYKTRLLIVSKLSPLSVNRKLSSLRRYTRWLYAKGFIVIQLDVMQNVTAETPSTITPKQSVQSQILKEMIIHETPITALRNIAENEQTKGPKQYASFAPIRLGQKVSELIILGANNLIIDPMTNIAESVQYTLTSKTPQTLFTPVDEILKATQQAPLRVLHSDLQNTAISTLQGLNSAELASKIPTNTTFTHTHSHTKNKIDNLFYNMLHKRPVWYKKYHSYAFVHNLHGMILILATLYSGFVLYQSWHNENHPSQGVLSMQVAAQPRELAFQGRLLDKTNTPITENTPLRFIIYSSPTATGSAKLWDEKQQIKPDNNGYFTTKLGRISRLNQEIFSDNASLYIGITINDNEELKPRQQLPNTTYTANAQAVQGLKPITDDPNSAKNVLLALDSLGNLTIGGSVSPIFQATGGKFTLSGQSILLSTNPESNGNITISPDGSGIIDLQKPIQNTSNHINDNGIAGAINIEDTLDISPHEGSQSALVINQNGQGDIISGFNNGSAKFRLDKEGNTLIGGRLVINGNTIGTNATTFGIADNNVNNLSIGNNASIVSLGGNSGITTIRNSLIVKGTSTLNGGINAFGSITANEGIVIPQNKKLTLSGLTSGSIAYIDSTKQLAGDAGHFAWMDTQKTLKVTGSLCVRATDGACGSTSGTIYASNVAIQQAADLAENYISGQELEPGDVVVPEGQNNSLAIIKATLPYQRQVLGIISTKPGFTLNSDAQTDQTHPNSYPLALQGRVPVKVTTINGTIQPGDDLASSPIPGVAMKASLSGQTIGKALEANMNPDPTNITKIMAFVNVSYHHQETAITNDGTLTTARGTTPEQTTNQLSALTKTIGDITSTISLGIITAKSVTTDSLHITSENITIGGQTLKDYLTQLVTTLIDQELDKRGTKLITTNQQIIMPIASSAALMIPSPTITPDTSATASAQMPTETPIASESANRATASASITQTASDAAQPTIETQPENDTMETPTAIIKDYTPTASISSEITTIPNLKADFATFNQGIIAIGPTSMTDATISNQLTVNNNIRISDATINTLGSDLNIQPLRQGNISFMGGLLTIDTQGNLSVSGDATFAKNVSVTGELAARIIAPVPNEDLIINLKDKSKNKGSSLVVKNASNAAVLSINQSGDINSSGEGTFTTIQSRGLSIVRGAEADTSLTETVTDSSAGRSTILANETQRTIFTPYVTDHSLIYITATSNTQNQTPYLARQAMEDTKKGMRGSFTIQIPYPSTNGLNFNWWIVN